MSSNKLETKNIRAVFILEILGRPPEHIITTLEEIVKQIGNEKGVTILSKKIGEAQELEKEKGFYSSFAELEVEVEEILTLAILMFKYMPAHIEIISPELIALTNNGWNDIFNELIRKLHQYDEIAKILQLQKNQIEMKLREVLGQQQGIKKVDAPIENPLQGRSPNAVASHKEKPKKKSKR